MVGGLSVLLAVSLAGCGSPDQEPTSSQPAAAAVSSPASSPSVTDAKSRETLRRTKAVPAPTPGTTKEVIKAGRRGTVKRAGLRSEVTLPNGVRVKATSIKNIQATAQTPGEMVGAALAITLRLKNSSENPINIDSAVIGLSDATGNPAQPTTSDPFKPFQGEIAPGSTSLGTYVFLIPKQDRKDLVLTVEYLAGQPIADFVGDAS